MLIKIKIKLLLWETFDYLNISIVSFCMLGLVVSPGRQWKTASGPASPGIRISITETRCLIPTTLWSKGAARMLKKKEIFCRKLSVNDIYVSVCRCNVPTQLVFQLADSVYKLLCLYFFSPKPATCYPALLERAGDF